MKAKQFYNVKSFSKYRSEILIRELHSPNYFGLTVTSNTLIKRQHEKKEIEVNFFKEGKIVESKSFTANIYRPELSVIEKPESIVLGDNSRLNELLNISLKVSGFGSIEVTTEVSFGGEFQPNVEPLFQEMARRFSTFFRNESNSDDSISIAKREDKSSLPKRRIEVNPLYIKKTTRAFIDQLKKGSFPSYSREDVEGFKKWVEKEANEERLRRFLSQHLESIIVESLLYYFNKYPTDGVALSGGNPSIIIKSAVEKMKVRFRYKDSLWNEYEPIPVEIVVKDLRTDKSKELKIPLNIKWIHAKINPPLEGKC